MDMVAVPGAEAHQAALHTHTPVMRLIDLQVGLAERQQVRTTGAPAEGAACPSWCLLSLLVPGSTLVQQFAGHGSIPSIVSPVWTCLETGM